MPNPHKDVASVRPVEPRSLLKLYLAIPHPPTEAVSAWLSTHIVKPNMKPANQT